MKLYRIKIENNETMIVNADNINEAINKIRSKGHEMIAYTEL